jgi:hypothetical protein
MASKAYIGKEVKDKIAELYLGDKKASGKEIQNKVNEWLKNEKHSDREIALSTVQRELAEHHKKEKSRGVSPLDNPWTIGACLGYDIAPTDIPILVELKQILSKESNPRTVTIRQARWFASLYPLGLIVADEDKKYRAQDLKQDLIIFEIASQYAIKEQIAELMGEDYPDTRELDEVLFIRSGNGDIDASITKASEIVAAYLKRKEKRGK